MKFYRLISDDQNLFPQAYALYEASFPEHEQRSLLRQKELLRNPAYHLDLLLTANSLAGLLAHWDFGSYTYIEHFAISPELRGRSLGSSALEIFTPNYPLVILEIDPPVDPISVRRERFYHNQGFQTNPYPHRHPAYKSDRRPHQLVVMSCPRPLSEPEYNLFAEDLEQKVMNDIG